MIIFLIINNKAMEGDKKCKCNMYLKILNDKIDILETAKANKILSTC